MDRLAYWAKPVRCMCRNPLRGVLVKPGIGRGDCEGAPWNTGDRRHAAPPQEGQRAGARRTARRTSPTSRRRSAWDGHQRGFTVSARSRTCKWGAGRDSSFGKASRRFHLQLTLVQARECDRRVTSLGMRKHFGNTSPRRTRLADPRRCARGRSACLRVVPLLGHSRGRPCPGHGRGETAGRTRERRCRRARIRVEGRREWGACPRRSAPTSTWGGRRLARPHVSYGPRSVPRRAITLHRFGGRRRSVRRRMMQYSHRRRRRRHPRRARCRVGEAPRDPRSRHCSSTQ